ncbi:MAG TPA: hypothetical protein PKE40_10110 [Arachnia sp.]|nr:hypothetical protein [Arachnia sp.]HMT86695.1 hypothetical protein [Arachnia sp.]
MVTTLIKHDVIRTRSLLLGAAGIAVAIATVLALSAWLIGGPLGQMSWVFGLVLTFGFLPLAQLWLGVDLYRSSFSKRGYFVQTLPMRGTAILTAKYLWALLVTVFALVVSIIVGTITAAGAAAVNSTSLQELWSVLNEALRMLDLSPWVWWLVIFFFLVYLVQGVVQYYFCVALGSESWINKLGGVGPILVWVGLYVAFQLLSLLSLFIPGSLVLGGGGVEFTWNSFFYPLVSDLAEGAEGAALFPVATIWVMLLALGVLVWRSYVSMGRKVDLR